MPLKKLDSLDKELEKIDAEYIDLNVPKDSEHVKEIKNMKKNGVSLEDVKEAVD